MYFEPITDFMNIRVSSGANRGVPPVRGGKHGGIDEKLSGFWNAADCKLPPKEMVHKPFISLLNHAFITSTKSRASQRGCKRSLPPFAPPCQRVGLAAAIP